jgi:hypothetical protein
MSDNRDIVVQDSVVMGNIEQNFTTVNESKSITCPVCKTENVRIMLCVSKACQKRFCEICHPNCKYTDTGIYRYNSGVGYGPCCYQCLKDLNNLKQLISKLYSKKQAFIIAACTTIVALFLTFSARESVCMVVLLLLLALSWTIHSNKQYTESKISKLQKKLESRFS